MNLEDFKRINSKIDTIEERFLDLTEERDKWKDMYYELKKSSESLMEDVKRYIQKQI